MNPFSILWIEIIKRPIFNILLLLLAAFWGNLGWAIIVLTLIIRLLLLKNSAAAADMQWSMGELQPKMQEIQEKYADDPQKMQSEMMALMKKSGGGPLKGCLSMLIQVPVFLGLFYTVRDLSLGTLNIAPYSFLAWLPVDLATITTNFYGIDLLASNNIILTVIAAVLMYCQMKFTTMVKPPKAPWGLGALAGWDKVPDMGKMMWFMNIFFVVMMGWFVWSMPAAIGVYIATTTLFGVLQLMYQYRTLLNAKWLAWRGQPQIIEE